MGSKIIESKPIFFVCECQHKGCRKQATHYIATKTTKNIYLDIHYYCPEHKNLEEKNDPTP